MDILQAGASWLHVLATVILLGYYAVLALVLMPVLRRTVGGPAMGRLIPAIERRAVPFLLASMGVFLATGLYLMLTDDRFPGPGSFLESSWSSLIVIKHVLVIGLVGLGISINLLIVPEIADPVDEAARSVAIRRLAAGATAMTGLGALVLLLTGAAQAG